MGRIVVIAMMAGLVWIGVEIHQHGVREAFGGTFAFLAAGDDLPERASEYVSRPQRIAREVDDRIREGAARYEDVVEE
jgi:hypothetical protein